jgi:hypothetical protein
MTGYLEQNRRGLIHTAFISCEDASRDLRFELRERPRQRSTLVSELVCPELINSGAPSFYYANPVPQDLLLWLKWP